LPKPVQQLAVELPADAPATRLQIPQPEPVPEPKPEPEPPEPEPPPPEEPPPEPEPDAPPLPSVFQDAKPVRRVRIKYPPEAEAQHIEGRVKARLTVAEDGSVTGVEVLAAEPPGVFEEVVLEALRQYRFKRDGTRYRADQEVIFKIDP
jgi:protein TonB